MAAQLESVYSPIRRESVIENEIPYTDSDIVITGISGRLPESTNIDEFKKNLMNEIDMVTVDEGRWARGLYGLPVRYAKIKDLSHFDATFFGIHSKQAHAMDPQLRLMLESTYEAIIDAGINPTTMRGSRTGVFVGISTSESDEFWLRDPKIINGYNLLGSSRSMFANRISYAFDFTGPSYALDTACSSSLYATHQAVSAIRAGECDAAIVGGLNLVLRPNYSLQCLKLNMLSQDGKCKTFDVSANGYVRADAVVAIYLQKAKDARRVYATVIRTKTNIDGYKSEGITYPNGEKQYELMRDIYTEAGINPVDVSYVEAHGTGTKVGDRVEVNSIEKLFCKDRNTPLLIGSVKSNMGHSEPASGLCSIAKILIAMEAGVIPANLHFKTPNPNIPALKEGRIRVVDKATPWNGGLVGINSFGFGGANAHVILRSNPKRKSKPSPPLNITELLPKLVAVSGRTKEGVHTLLNKAQEHRNDDEFLSLLRIIHNNAIFGHDFRGYEILNIDGTREVTEITSSKERRPIWFVFSGMGTQWAGMGHQLFGIETFQRSLRQCAVALAPHGIDLMTIIMNATDKIIEEVINSFVAITAMQVALVDVLTSIGISPDGIVGHSTGELACAYADGAFTLEQTILAAYYRGKAIIDSKLESGAMAAVGLSWEEARKICPPNIFPACHNAKDIVTISGPTESVQKFAETLKSKDIFVKKVRSSGFAFHSKYIASAGPKLRDSLDKVIPNPKQRSARWISSSIPESAWDSPLAQTSSSAYHVNNLLSPVLFQEAMAHIPENAITIEIAPDCLLQTILRRSLPPTITYIGLHKRNHLDNVAFLLSNVGKMYNTGAKLDILKLYPPISFPVGRGTPMIGPLIKWDHSTAWNVPNFNQTSRHSGEHIVEINISKETDAYLAGHQIDGRVYFPVSGYILLVWKTLAEQRGTDFERLPVVFENVRFQRSILMPKEKTVKFLITIFEGTGDFEICEGATIVVSGNVRVSETIAKDQLELLPTPVIRTDDEILPLTSKDIYKELRLRGCEYRDVFQGIKSCDNYVVTGQLYWFNKWIPYIDTMLQFGIMSANHRLMYVPKRIQYAAIDPILHKQLVKELPEDGGLPVYHYKDSEVIDSGGIELRGLKLSLARRRHHTQVEPKYERYIFVPYENSHNLDHPRGGKIYALTILLQIMCENMMALKLKTVEVAGKRVAEDLLAPIIFNIFNNELISPIIDLQVIAAPVHNYIQSLNQMKVNANVVMRDVKEVPPALDVHFVIAADVLSNKSYVILKNLVAALKPGCFILLEESTVHLDLKTVLEENDLSLAGKQTDPIGKTFLLLKKREEKKQPVVIQITDKNLSWLEDVETALKKSDSENQEVFFISQNEETLGNANARFVFIQDKNAPKFDLTEKFYAEQLNKGLTANVLKGGQWGSYRHVPLDVSCLQVHHVYANTLKWGDLSSLKWIKSPLNYDQNFLNKKLCYVYYAPINVRDIMLASDKLPLDILPRNVATKECVLGYEFSGRDAEGRRVMGIVEAKGIATTVVADLDFLWDVPDRWTLEEAATIPIAYATSYYALFIRGRLKAGESVLIHAGNCGVGEAAIAIALHAGCIVFTTVDTPEKRDYLKKVFPQLNDRHIGNARDTSFERLIRIETQGRGVDVVLNSLGEEKLQAGIRCLADYGRFLEAGKYDLSNVNHIGMSLFSNNMSFHDILLDTVFGDDVGENDRVIKKKLVKLISEGIKNGAVRPLQSIVFLEQQLEQGFRFMATGKHFGKVLLKIRDEEPRKRILPTPKAVAAIPRTYMNPEKSYVLVGGLGGFGLELADWMISRGAKFIVLVSRSGIRTGYQAFCVRRWRENGVKIIIFIEDVTTPSGAQRLIQESNQLAPVGGVFNLAVVIRDALIENLKEADFKAVILPKVNITRNLDAISRMLCPLLDYFVVFSSWSSGRGSIGQTNYAFANSTMERIMEERQSNGLPGLAIQWGAIGDVGLVMEMMGGNDVEVSGTIPQHISSCLATMDIFLQEPHPVLASTVFAKKYKSDDDNKTDLVATVANVLGIKGVDSINPNITLADLGLDSLMNTEIKQTLEGNYDIVLSALEIRALTITKLRELSSMYNE
ncbi:fatty acid synthase-like [Solenopsis invicta]|uniref:fatty acid synthase-like n=1 Tax=Solenopsis invicta TaxID=13686 RepID=UPI00193CF78E|nr:fatty acid synthase-like [Solenopsis invicta]